MFPEFVASFLARGDWPRSPAGRVAARLADVLGPRIHRLFVSLSLGLFIYVAGINTNVIGLWLSSRDVPAILTARSPARFAVVAALGLSLLVAFALEELRRRYGPPRRAGIFFCVLLAMELLPAPRPLYRAAVPDVYRLIATTGTEDESARLLELPTEQSRWHFVT